METLHQAMIKIEEDYAVCSDSDPDSAYMSSSWDWKNNGENNSLSPTPSPHSLSPVASFESPYSACSHPSTLEEMAFVDDVLAYRLLPNSSHCQYDMAKGRGHPRRERGFESTVTAQRRRKASEREKMRMRAIADALHNLRSNLPPIYSQGRQPLTKIQTLRCTISYIEELTNILNTTKET
ncbi:mesogenin-1 [Pelobates cultripes]|uniref:Mesogenin-1 n=1 Tax=Pelobates cultripes TaxID=61616 RepID=A0AAD1RAB2_PELCU|nr:mesogenin-1 [Pelobates cultripes]